jgi:hypothetical protein
MLLDNLYQIIKRKEVSKISEQMTVHSHLSDLQCIQTLLIMTYWRYNKATEIILQMHVLQRWELDYLL